jgi:hypothetical protein
MLSGMVSPLNRRQVLKKNTFFLCSIDRREAFSEYLSNGNVIETQLCKDPWRNEQ